MKSILKVFLLTALLCGHVMAEGEMGSGGYTGCSVEDCPPPPPPCTENCRAAFLPAYPIADKAILFIVKNIDWLMR